MHIPKPVEPAELTTVVASLAERYIVPPVILSEDEESGLVLIK